MVVSAKIRREVTELTLAWIYFVAWFGFLILLKQLTLAEYQVEFQGYSIALVGALILAKVVLILEHVPPGKWAGSRPAWVDVAARTILYAGGVVVVLILEKGLEGRRDHGGFGASVRFVMQHSDAHHIRVNALCVTSALLGYNMLSVVRQHLGARGVARMFRVPLPKARHGEPQT
ncbi:MAG TPA: hypothetical protein VFT13_06695 [Candidatus Krumholzibacteria bacterium]|nr:hypothetical protein [Candidatus Krumholzibacteria bacterium]